MRYQVLFFFFFLSLWYPLNLGLKPGSLLNGWLGWLGFMAYQPFCRLFNIKSIFMQIVSSVYISEIRYYVHLK